MSQIKYAIFDVGQTIYPFTPLPLYRLMENLTIDKESYAKDHSANHYSYTAYMKGQLSNQEFAEELCSFCRVPYSPLILPQINKALHQGCGTPFPETKKVMQQLKNNGIELGILTNAIPLLADTTIDIVKSQYIFTSYDLGLLKPDLAIYQELATRLGCNYSEILFIDDKKQNIEAAKSLGINGITFQKDCIQKEIQGYIKSSNFPPDNSHFI